jgi:hypothetical protein
MEAAVLAAIDVEAAMDQVRALVDFGEKIAGSPEELAAQQYIHDEFSKLPLDAVAMTSFPTSSWSHRGEQMSVIVSGPRLTPSGAQGPTPRFLPPLVVIEFPTTVYAYSHGISGTWFGEPYSHADTRVGGLQREVVDVGFGTEAEFLAVGDLGGAIALVHRDDGLTGWPHVLALHAMEFGASAIVLYGYSGAAGNVHPDGIKQDVLGVEIPAFSISVDSAARIKELLAEGPVTLQLVGESNMVSEDVAESVNVAGYLYGSKYPNEYIIISAHVDTWWGGVQDDTTGVAVVMELARVFSQLREAGELVNDRTLVFLSVGAEEFGGPKDTWWDWLAGSYEYVLAHPQEMERLVVELNVEGGVFEEILPGHYLPTTWEIEEFVDSTMVDLGSAFDGAYAEDGLGAWDDAWSFGVVAGGSAIAGGYTTADFGKLYHTQLDDLDHVGTASSPDLMQAYALIALRADQALVLPYDLTATADWAADALAWQEGMVPEAARKFSAARRELEAFRTAAEAAKLNAAQLRSDYEAAPSDAVRDAIRLQADALNENMMAARKRVNPWMLGVGDIWTVGSMRTEQHVLDIGQIDAALSALSFGQVESARDELEYVYNMLTGQYLSEQAYTTNLEDMEKEPLYWGGESDLAQQHADVHWIYAGLGPDGSMTPGEAITELQAIRDNQLLVWLKTDLEALEGAWHDAAEILAPRLIVIDDPIFFDLPTGSLRYAVSGYDPGTDLCITAIWILRDASDQIRHCDDFGPWFPYVVIAPGEPAGCWDSSTNVELLSASGCVDWAAFNSPVIPWKGASSGHTDEVDLELQVASDVWSGTVRFDGPR